MAKLIELLEFEKKTSSKLKNEYNSKLQKNEELIKNYKNLSNIIKDKDKVLRNLITDNIIENIKFREEYWREYKELPNSLIDINTCEGYVKDNYSGLALLPQVKLSKLRELANTLKMVIIPIHYTQISELFATQDNEKELEYKFNLFRELLINDKTRKYQMYVLCPINYYSIWEQIKSDVDKHCYFSDYFEIVETTLRLMIPTQKNLYLSIQTNNENLKNIENTFNDNIKTLDNQINFLSDKINKVESELLSANRKLQQQVDKQTENLKNLEMRMVEEIKEIYRNLDPILFAVEEEIDIIEDDTNAIIGLCWGKDIDDNYVKLKGLSINNKNIEKANPIPTIINIEDIKEPLNVKKSQYKFMTKDCIYNLIFPKIKKEIESIIKNKDYTYNGNIVTVNNGLFKIECSIYDTGSNDYYLNKDVEIKIYDCSGEWIVFKTIYAYGINKQTTDKRMIKNMYDKCEDISEEILYYLKNKY